MSVKNPSAALPCISFRVIPDLNMISTCEILTRVKSLQHFQFVADYGKDQPNSRLVFLDIKAFKEAGLDVSDYRKLFRVKIEDNALTGATVCGSLSFNRLI